MRVFLIDRLCNTVGSHGFTGVNEALEQLKTISKEDHAKAKAPDRQREADLKRTP